MISYLAHLTAHELPSLLGWMVAAFAAAVLVSAAMPAREDRDRS